jgi:hypothetical protein
LTKLWLFRSITENPNHRNLINQIISLYGRETLDEIRVLEKLRVKIKRRVADLEFLKKCRDENVLPKFACRSNTEPRTNGTTWPSPD